MTREQLLAKRKAKAKEEAKLAEAAKKNALKKEVAIEPTVETKEIPTSNTPVQNNNTSEIVKIVNGVHFIGNGTCSEESFAASLSKLQEDWAFFMKNSDDDDDSEPQDIENDASPIQINETPEKESVTLSKDSSATKTNSNNAIVREWNGLYLIGTGNSSKERYDATVETMKQDLAFFMSHSDNDSANESDIEYEEYMAGNELVGVSTNTIME